MKRTVAAGIKERTRAASAQYVHDLVGRFVRSDSGPVPMVAGMLDLPVAKIYWVAERLAVAVARVLFPAGRVLAGAAIDIRFKICKSGDFKWLLLATARLCCGSEAGYAGGTWRSGKAAVDRLTAYFPAAVCCIWRR